MLVCVYIYAYMYVIIIIKERTVIFRMRIIGRNMERNQERAGGRKVKVESNVFLFSLKCFRNKHGAKNTLVLLKRTYNSEVEKLPI